MVFVLIGLNTLVIFLCGATCADKFSKKKKSSGIAWVFISLVFATTLGLNISRVVTETKIEMLKEIQQR